MDQRLFLAIVLSMAVIFGYYTFFPPPAPPPPPPENTAATAPPAAGSAEPSDPASPPGQPAAVAAPQRQAANQPREARVVRVDTPLYTARIDTRGALLVGLELKEYRQAKVHIDWGDLIPPLGAYLKKPVLDFTAPVEMVKRELQGAEPLGVEFVGADDLTRELRNVVYTTDLDSVRIEAGMAEPRQIVFTGAAKGGITVRKVLTFHADSYIINAETQVINYGEKPQRLRVRTLLGEGPSRGPGEDSVRAFFGPIYREDGSVDTEDADDVGERLIVREPDWLGITSNYFITAAAPESRISHADYGARNIAPAGADEEWAAFYGVELPVVELSPGNLISSQLRLYIGPKKLSELEKFGDNLGESLDLTLDVLASPLLVMLRWFHGYTGNYGVAIILLTCVVRIGLFPLTYKGMVSMKRMGKLQPKMKAVREKYKDNKEKVNKEMMDLYRRYKINPLGGCLPIALQIPIFFALYSALLGAIELRHSPFIWWIQDLSAMDPLYVTPLLMGGSMFLQQKLTPTTMDPAQQRILMWMPLIFMVFMFSFPSGLVLYWLTSNTLSILQQLIINRVKVPELVEQKA